MTASGPATVVVVGGLHYAAVIEVPGRLDAGLTLNGHARHTGIGGMGAGQAIAAARAGAKVALIGAIGRDVFASALLEALDAAGVDRSGVATLDGMTSGLKIALSGPDGEFGTVVVAAANLALDAAAVAARGAAIDQARVLLLQNEVPDEANLAAAERARTAGCITILNGAPAREPCAGLPDAIDLLVVDASEAERLGGGPVSSRREALAAAVLLLDRFGAVVVTAAQAGLAYADRIGTRTTLQALQVEAVTGRGAGEAFVGTLAAALAQDAGMTEALEAASTVAAAHLAGWTP